MSSTHTASRNLEAWQTIAPTLAAICDRAYSPAWQDGESAVASVCPPRDLVFRALECVHPDAVRVVILGQDPYHVPGKASGLAFGYAPEYPGKLDSSQLHIREEMEKTGPDIDPNLHEIFWPRYRWQTLEHLPPQGVLLLNTRLSVLAGKPLSHADGDHRAPGWEGPVRDIIRHLAARGGQIVWLLWGGQARYEAQQAGLDTSAGNVIRCSHPSRFSHKTGHTPFTGSNCFGVANMYLSANNQQPISWLGTPEQPEPIGGLEPDDR